MTAESPQRNVTTAAAPEAASLSSAARALSVAEFLLGGAIVAAHNVFHVVPNEVPILFVLGIASISLREGGWRAVGLVRPKSWFQTILIAAVTAGAVILLGQFVTDPLAAALGLHASKTAAGSPGLKSYDAMSLIKGLAVTWTFSAFGEEIAYRRYLIGRAADVGGRTPLAYAVALLAVSALFGIGHYDQGPARIFTTACDGFVIGAAYLLSGRNLWVAVLTHGLIDTFAFAALFVGLAE